MGSASGGFGAQRRVSRNVGSGLATLAVKLERAGSQAQKVATHQGSNPWLWATANVGQKVSATLSVVMPSSVPTATHSVGMVSTTTIGLLSKRGVVSDSVVVVSHNSV